MTFLDGDQPTVDIQGQGVPTTARRDWLNERSESEQVKRNVWIRLSALGQRPCRFPASKVEDIVANETAEYWYRERRGTGLSSRPGNKTRRRRKEWRQVRNKGKTTFAVNEVRESRKWYHRKEGIDRRGPGRKMYKRWARNGPPNVYTRRVTRPLRRKRNR